MSTDPNRLEHCVERRGAQRFEVHLPLAVHFEGRTVPGFTQNLSGRGIFFYAETALPEGAVVERQLKGRSLLLSKRGEQISCYDNACAHLGMPLDMGEVRDGVITCSYHGFKYLLETGECLTAPEVQLKVHAVRVTGQRVQVRLEE